MMRASSCAAPATITYAGVSMNAPPYNPTSYQVLIPTSSRFQIVSVFPGTGPGLATQYVNINGTSYLATGFSLLACFTQSCAVSVGANTISIIYQPEYFNYFIAAYLVFILAVVALAGLILRERTPGGRYGHRSRKEDHSSNTDFV